VKGLSENTLRSESFPKCVPNRPEPRGDRKTKIGPHQKIPAFHCRGRITPSRLKDFQSDDFCLTRPHNFGHSYLIRSRNQKIPVPLRPQRFRLKTRDRHWACSERRLTSCEHSNAKERDLTKKHPRHFSDMGHRAVA
jgi:hypothetical protein